ncbi:ribonuclease H-like domain-containing protein [Robertmurraya korlensis]|uniref:ribonuclease H-like domain-containing protein n=1 Tax=Robertmurraya korlensis TaxID=519977 RepID=UPI000826ED2B|nr:ribonuclease H-like domain-containing protein [Robertmurraya korlensis]
MSLKNKLNRLKPHLSNPEKSKESSRPLPLKTTNEIPFLSDWKENGVTPYFLGDDYCLVREVKYPLDHQHGRYQLGDFIDAVNAWNEANISHPLSSKGFLPEQLFFFDTETTGLGGGVGNTIFLLGHATVEDNHFVLRQHILPRPGSEIPLYTSFLEKVDYTTLVTYNGKAFDWPQVKTRHTLLKDHVPNLPLFGHFDLFHASRRIWKHKLERLKLSIVEKEILDIQRVDDVPGFLAPMIYFDFVETQKPEGMLGIMKHNEIDILSLISLYTHLTFQILRIDQNQTVKEAFEVGRWFSYLGEDSAAENTFTQLASGESMEAYKSRWQLSLQLKKKKDYEAASHVWLNLSNVADDEIAFDSSLELSKWYEHKKRNYEKALYYSQNAKILLEKRCDSKKDQMMDIEKRLERITRKYCNKNVKK